jgi:DNA-binding NarL/FixJ family response regulator
MTAPDFLRGQPPTPREMQVVRLVARGMTNMKIAAELDLSPLTVKTHVARIGVKFGTGDRAGIVGTAIRRGLLQVRVTGLTPPGFDEGLFDVLVRIARGLDNREIAADLGLPYETVKSRVRRLLAVLGVCSREEAVVAGVACGALRLVRRQVPAQRRERVAA